MNAQLRRRIASAALIIGFFVFWELACIAFGIRDIILPRPTQIVATLVQRMPAVWPHALQTLYTTLVGFGRANLITKRVDLIVKPETGSTSLLALKLPLRITGSFDRLSVAPSFESSASEPPVGDPGHLLKPELQLLAERNPCRH